MGWIETHKSFVNTWECDENDHMNVQFYYKRFAHAGEIFAIMNGLDRAKGALPLVRDVRFLSEINFNASTVVKSAIIGDGEYKGAIAHMLFDANTDALSATAIDRIEGLSVSEGLPIVSSIEAVSALPKGLDLECEPIRDTSQMLASGKATLSNLHVVQMEDCDCNGNLATQYYIARFTDGAPHIWDHAHLGSGWLKENNFGRVAVEMKLCPIGLIKAGTPLRQASWIEAMNSKIFKMHHQLENFETGEVMATGAVVGLVMDLNKRRSVEVPEIALNRFEELSSL